MPTAYILQSRARIHLVSERLEVKGVPDGEENGGRERVLREIPLRDIERLVVEESVQVSAGALSALLRAKVAVSVMGWNGAFLGGFHPPGPAHGLTRLRQYAAVQDAARTAEMARRLVEAKVYNQKRVLQRLALARKRRLGEEANPTDPPGPGPEGGETGPVAGGVLELARSTVNRMEGMFTGLRNAAGVDEIRGFEGAAAAAYFRAWAGFLPEAFPFERRSKQPPLNPVNACISFGASLVYHEMTAALHAHGLDPALGYLHTTQNDRWSLALDLMEPFRPALHPAREETQIQDLPALAELTRPWIFRQVCST